MDINEQIKDAYEYSQVLWREWYAHNGTYGLTRDDLKRADDYLNLLRDDRDKSERSK